MLNSTDYYPNRKLLSTITFINYTTFNLTYIYNYPIIDEGYPRSRKRLKFGGKDGRTSTGSIYCYPSCNNNNMKYRWQIVARQSKYKFFTTIQSFFMLIWCKSGCQQPNPRLLGEQGTGGAWWWIQRSCPDCSEAALEACMCSSWGSLRHQYLQHRTGSSFLWHHHYDPHPQNHQLHPSLKKKKKCMMMQCKIILNYSYDKYKKQLESLLEKRDQLKFYPFLTAKPHHHQDGLPRIWSHHTPITKKVRRQRWSKWDGSWATKLRGKFSSVFRWEVGKYSLQHLKVL